MNAKPPPESTLVDVLIDRSSLGEPAVKKLRARTPPELARQIVERSHSARGVSGGGDIGVFIKTPPARGPKEPP
jgi:hypothetical protein